MCLMCGNGLWMYGLVDWTCLRLWCKKARRWVLKVLRLDWHLLAACFLSYTTLTTGSLSHR